MDIKNFSKIIDLTHKLNANTPTFDLDCGFSISTACDYSECTPPNLFKTQNVNTVAGIGTHIDSPAHSFQDKDTIDQIQLQDLVVPCAVINVSGEASADYLAGPETIQSFEEQYGEIQPGTFVIFYTGWDRFWADKQKFRNDLKFPGVHQDAAQVLIEKGVTGIGIDTLSTDTRGEDFPVHRIVLGAGKYLVENVANASQLPPSGAMVAILPMNIENGTEAPVRMAAFI